MRLKLAILAAVLVFAAAAFSFFSTRSSHTHPGKSAAEKSAAVYYCPMHPTYTSDRPGDCPICNMKLVKRGQAEPAAPGAKAMTAEDICYMHDCPLMKPGEKCPMMVVAKKGEAVTCPICGTHVAEHNGSASLKKVLYWTDPMMPGFKSDKPGKSPMGMDLVPVYAESGATENSMSAAPPGYAPILLAPQKRQFIGVRAAKVEKRAVSKTIRTVGRIAYDPELYQAEQEYISALKALKDAEKGTSMEAADSARRLVESSQTRLRLLGLSKELIEEVASLDRPDKSLLLTDPSGRAWLYAPVYEYELPFVKVGQEVRVEVSTALGKALNGLIRSIDSVLDPATRTARVRATLVDTDGALKPEMYVNASIFMNAGEVLAMPEEALFDTGAKKIVFVDKGDGLFEPRDVQIGLKGDGFYEVKSGVSEGESVVTSGNFLIDSESRLKAALEGMQEGGGHSHG